MVMLLLWRKHMHLVASLLLSVKQNRKLWRWEDPASIPTSTALLLDRRIGWSYCGKSIGLEV